MKSIRNKIKQIWIIRILIVSYRILKSKYSLIERLKLIKDYFKDLKKFENLEAGNFKISYNDLKPCIYDRTKNTPTDPVYFYQDSWCAGKIFKARPTHHYDIASNNALIGIISQFVPTTMIDIRPIDLRMPGLFFEKGSILNLPFEDNTIESMSSICVIEHIGLGRYGDELDTFGSEKAIEEIIRVMKTDGDLYISLPVDTENKIYFNAHRAFTRDYIMKLFSKMNLIEEKYIYGKDLFDKYDTSQGFGTGMYHFKK